MMAASLAAALALHPWAATASPPGGRAPHTVPPGGVDDGDELASDADADADADADDPAVDDARTIVVTASRTAQAIGDVAVSTRVIGRQEIAASGAEDAAALLEEQPGLQVLRSFAGAGGAGVQMQGLDAKYVLILVDGMRVSGQVGGVIDLTRFRAEDIAQIELVKGPGSSLYGADAIAGVINIITRRASEPLEIDARARYGSFHTADLAATVGGQRGRWSTRWSGGWSHTAGFDRDPSTPSTTGNAGHTLHGAQRTEVRVGPDLVIGAHADVLRRDLRGVDSNPAGAVFDRRNLTHTTSATVTAELHASGPSRLRLISHLAYFDDAYSLDQRGSDALDQAQRTRDTIGQLSALYDHAIAGGHLFSAGAEVQLERLSTPRLVDERATRQRLGLYVQDEWRVLPRPLVVVVPGVRLDVDSQFGAYSSPRLALRVDPREDLTLRASAGLGYRAPSFRELYLSFANPSAGYRVSGNPGLRAETSRSATAGIAWTLGPRRQLALDLFHHQLHDLIAIDASGGPTGTSVFRYTNIGAAVSQGAELLINLGLGSSVDAELGYTATRTRDLERQRPLPGRPAHRIHGRLRWEHKAWKTSAQARAAVQGTQYFFTGDEEGLDTAIRIAPYATVDLRLGQPVLGGRLTVFAGVDNLLDAGDAVYLPLIPRLFYGGLSAHLLPKTGHK